MEPSRLNALGTRSMICKKSNLHIMHFPSLSPMMPASKCAHVFAHDLTILRMWRHDAAGVDLALTRGVLLVPSGSVKEIGSPCT